MQMYSMIVNLRRLKPELQRSGQGRADSQIAECDQRAVVLQPQKALRLPQLDEREFLFGQIDDDHTVVRHGDVLPTGIDLKRVPLAGGLRDVPRGAGNV